MNTEQKSYAITDLVMAALDNDKHVVTFNNEKQYDKLVESVQKAILDGLMEE